MNPHDIDKAYISPFDKFLFGFDATHEKTPSQIAEGKKYQRIRQLRDTVQPGEALIRHED